jgi:hypothetical protein
MESSSEILVVAGTLALMYGLLLGIPMGQARMASPTAPRHLTTTHLEGLMSGAALLGLSLAASYSTLPRGLELTGAWMMTVGVAASLAGGTLNWLLEAEDAFAERTPGFLLQAVSGPMMVAGGGILTAGVIKAL